MTSWFCNQSNTHLHIEARTQSSSGTCSHFRHIRCKQTVCTHSRTRRKTSEFPLILMSRHLHPLDDYKFPQLQQETRILASFYNLVFSRKQANYYMKVAQCRQPCFDTFLTGNPQPEVSDKSHQVDT